MTISYIYHCKNFEAQYFARNLVLKDFLLERSLDVIERVVLKLINDLSEGKKSFSIQKKQVFFEGKPFIFDFSMLYRSLSELLKICVEENIEIDNLKKEWKGLFNDWKEEFDPSQLISLQALYLESQALLEAKEYEKLMHMLISKQASPVKDYFLRLCGVYFIRQNLRFKTDKLIHLINSSFDRSVVLGESARKAFSEKNLMLAKTQASSITNPHLQHCFLDMRLSQLNLN